MIIIVVNAQRHHTHFIVPNFDYSSIIGVEQIFFYNIKGILSHDLGVLTRNSLTEIPVFKPSCAEKRISFK